MPRSDALGQFFTPRAVVELALDAFAALGACVADARVVDPACGPGEWLRASLERGAAEAVGADCDPGMARAWRDSGLSADPRCRLAVMDGLLPGALPDAAFDLALGNPPFGCELPDTRPDTLRLMARAYRLFAGPDVRLFRPEPSERDLQRLRRFPVELLFLERFVTLCRPGGWIAIILPEGVLSNARWRHVRRWLLEAVTVHAVIGLPRDTFRAHATTAKTCLLLIRNQPAPIEHHTALAEADSCEPAALRALLAALQEGNSAADVPPRGLVPPPLQRD